MCYGERHGGISIVRTLFLALVACVVGHAADTHIRVGLLTVGDERVTKLVGYLMNADLERLPGVFVVSTEKEPDYLIAVDVETSESGAVAISVGAFRSVYRRSAEVLLRGEASARAIEN